MPDSFASGYQPIDEGLGRGHPPQGPSGVVRPQAPGIWMLSGTVDEVAKNLQAKVDACGRWAFRILATTQSSDGHYLTVIMIEDEPRIGEPCL